MSGKGWIPGVIVVGLIIAGNVGARVHLPFGGTSTPSGVKDTVNGYYNAVENAQNAQAKNFICAARQSAWTTGQKVPAGDLKRGITGHTIGKIEHRNGQYLVHLTLTLKKNAAAPVVTVIPVGAGFRLCGGTGP